MSYLPIDKDGTYVVKVRKDGTESVCKFGDQPMAFNDRSIAESVAQQLTTAFRSRGWIYFVYSKAN